MDRTRIHGPGIGDQRRACVASLAGLWPVATDPCLQSEILEQHLLLARQEAQLQPAEDVIHDRLGVADIRVAAPAAGLEASMRELLAERLQRYAVLQRQ